MTEWLKKVEKKEEGWESKTFLPIFKPKHKCNDIKNEWLRRVPGLSLKDKMISWVIWGVGGTLSRTAAHPHQEEPHEMVQASGSGLSNQMEAPGQTQDTLDR